MKKALLTFNLAFISFFCFSQTLLSGEITINSKTYITEHIVHIADVADSTNYILVKSDSLGRYLVELDATAFGSEVDVSIFSPCNGEKISERVQITDEEIIIQRNFDCIKCEVDFTYSLIDSVVHFAAAVASNNAWYHWDFGDGSTLSSSEATISHTFTKNGHFNVCLNYSDSVTGCNEQVCSSIDIDIWKDINICSAIFSGSPLHIGINTDFTVEALLAKGNQNVLFTFGDGNTVPNKIATYAYKVTGNFNICAQVWTDDCADTVCQEIFVTANGIPECKGDFDFTKNNNDFTFSANAPYSGEISWDLGDGTFSEGIDASHSYDIAGTYTVCMQYINKDTDCSFEVCKKITADGCDGNFNYESDKRTITVTMKYATDLSKNKSLRVIDFGDGTVVHGQQQASHTYVNYGSYQICATYATENCTDKICKDITLVNREHTVGISDVTPTGKTLAAYPNPFTNKIMLDEQYIDSQYELYDLTGKVILSGKLSIPVLYTNSIQSGVYWLVISNSEERFTTRMVKLD
jgi:PKD repeat protein